MQLTRLDAFATPAKLNWAVQKYPIAQDVGILGLSPEGKSSSLSKRSNGVTSGSSLRNRREFRRRRLPEPLRSSNANRWKFTETLLVEGAGKSPLGNTAPGADAKGNQAISFASSAATL
jgi:hypothetical protein